jgi:hypothetical protein
MKTQILPLLLVVCAGFLGGCGKSDETAPAPDPVTQPEAQAALFQRSVDRIKSLIAVKDFGQAQRTLDSMAQYKLTPEQQEIVDKLKAQIPAN